MNRNSQRRIDRDVKVCMESKLYNFIADISDSNLYYFVFKPADGFYRDQTHVVQIKLIYGSGVEYKYPMSAPLCTFMTPIWHPNIGDAKSGIICVDILKEAWTSIISLDTICSTISLLLLEPNPDSPQNCEAAHEYMKDNTLFAINAEKYYVDNQGHSISEQYVRKKE